MGNPTRVWRPNSFLRLLSLSALAAAAVFTAAGCGPKYTYPAATVPESIERICLKEYKVEVDARVVGKTAAALYYVDTLLDDKGQIPREIHEKMGQIMQVVTRVALSTDLPLDFCVVVIRDRAHLNELYVTRSIDDTKRANSDAIGVEESINRTLFGQGKYQPNAEGEKSFVLDEVKLEDFLAEQIAQRIRFGFAKETKDVNDAAAAGAQAPFVLVDGVYNRDERKFRFSVLSLKAEEPQETMRMVLRMVKEVLGGYKFVDFDGIEILDYLNRQKLEISQDVFEDHLAKKVSEQEILDKYLTESQTIQEAFKLFGFNLNDTAEPEAPPVTAAAATATP
jgi:hypothetical protein